MRQNFIKELSKALNNSVYITEKDACLFPPELVYKDTALPVPRKRALSVKDAKRPDTSISINRVRAQVPQRAEAVSNQENHGNAIQEIKQRVPTTLREC
jgi:hypothetical protein